MKRRQPKFTDIMSYQIYSARCFHLREDLEKIMCVWQRRAVVGGDALLLVIFFKCLSFSAREC